MFLPGQRAGVAVSGGADSVCLLHVLRELAPHWDLRLAVIHVDHSIRGAASRADAEFARALAEQFSIPFHFRRVNVPALKDNLEQAARGVRRQFFLELLEAGAVERVATGHTRSDQAETVLYRILRGAGSAGLAGIRPIDRAGIVRPLLYSTRAEVQTWLEDRHILWREDESNRDLSYDRNRLRHVLLPQLRREYNPRVDETLANMAELARGDEEYWTERLDADPLPGDAFRLPIERLRGHPAPARRIVRQAIQAIKGDLLQISFDHVEAVLEMARSGEGHGRLQVPGVDVFRSFEWIRFAPAGHDNMRERDFSIPFEPPAEIAVPGAARAIRFQLLDREGAGTLPEACANVVDELDWQRISSSPAPAGASSGWLELRNWRPGDHYRPAGRRHDEKIKLLFQEARVPLWDRRSWPVLTAGGVIVWSRTFGPAEGFERGAFTTTILRIEDSNRPLP